MTGATISAANRTKLPFEHAQSSNDAVGSNDGRVPFPSSQSVPGTPARAPSRGPGALSPIVSGQTTPQSPAGAAETKQSESSTASESSLLPGLNLGTLPSMVSSMLPDKGNAGAPGTNTPAARALRPGMSRNVSIVQDLQARQTGALGAATPKVTPSDLELGANPFELSVAAAPAASSAATPSLQSSIAAKRPVVNRLTSEGTGPSPLSLNLKDRLERLTAAAASSKATQLPQTSGSTKPVRTTGSILEKIPADPPSPGGSYLGKLGDDASPSTPTGSPHMRRRSSSSASRTVSFSGSTPVLQRAFSRKGRGDHRRRSSSSTLDAGLAASIVSSSLGAHNDVPPFHFEHNPHGNGGLQNAVRSITDVHVRTTSEPVPAKYAETPSAAVRSSGVPGVKAAIGQCTWVGTPGCSIEDFDESLRKTMAKRYQDERHSAVVWVEDDVLEPAYDKFCKQNLWPTFHYQIHDAHKVSSLPWRLSDFKHLLDDLRRPRHTSPRLGRITSP